MPPASDPPSEPPASSTKPEVGATLGSRILALFAEVRPNEVVTVLLLTFTVFALLLAYYFLKVVREPLILASGGAEVKAYASAGQATLLMAAIPVHGALAKRFGPIRLVGGIYSFFVVCILAFALLAKLHAPIGIPFYLFVGVMSLMVVSQFWSFATDLYDEAQGKRLFAIVGVGSSVGAVVGAVLAGQLFRFLGPSGLLLVAGLVLAMCTAVLVYVNHRESKGAPSEPIVKKERGIFSGLQLIAKDRYLLLLASMAFMTNWVNTTGEYVLDRTLLKASPGSHEEVDKAVAAFKGNYFAAANGISMVLQLFVVSRLLSRLGARKTLFLIPIISLIGYSGMTILPLLAVVTAAKVAENSTDYSIGSTIRQVLYLVTSRESKFTAKMVIDAVIVRWGDVVAGGVIALAAFVHLPPRALAGMNVVLALVWIAIVVGIGREHAKLSKTEREPEAKPS